MNKPQTKSFPLNVILTVTTGRLLTTPKNGGNGIEDLYEILGWMTGESPFTHQLGRFAEEVKPHLFTWFPELGMASACLDLLDKRMASNKANGLRVWLGEIKVFDTRLKDNYDVPQIPKGSHTSKNPIEELVEMRVGKETHIIEVNI